MATETFSPAFDSLGFKFGLDKRGIPVTYNFYKSLSEEEMLQHLEEFKRWRVQLMESAIRDLDFEKGQETILQVSMRCLYPFFMRFSLNATSVAQ